MIRLEHLPPGSQLARVSAPGAGDHMPPIDAVFVLHADPVEPGAVWVKGFKGQMCRATLRELLAKLVELGIDTVLATRAEGHVLPLGAMGADGVVRISVAELRQRFGGPRV